VLDWEVCETKRKIQKKKKNTYGGRMRGEHVGVNGGEKGEIRRSSSGKISESKKS
jgi:hypothetical protein